MSLSKRVSSGQFEMVSKNNNTNNANKNAHRFKKDVSELRKHSKVIDPGDISSRTADENAFVSGARRVAHFVCEMWKKGNLCDAVLRVDGGEIRAHKIVLAAYSEALAEKFSEFSPREVIAIDLTDFKPDTIMSLLMFVYTTEITITDENVGAILNAAMELGIDVLIHMCLDYLSHFTPEMALSYYAISREYDLTDLQTKIYAYICENFLEVTRSQAFADLSISKLANFLSDDCLVVPSELDVFYAIVSWTDVNRSERIAHAPLLLRCVRFHLLSPDTLVSKVEVVDWLFTVRECKDMLYETFKYHCLKLSNSPLIEAYQLRGPRSKRYEFSPNMSNEA